MTAPSTRVVVGLQGVQIAANLTRGIGRWSLGMVNALFKCTGLEVALSVSPGQPLPPGLQAPDGIEIIRTREQLAEGGVDRATVFHILSPLEDLPLDVIWPTWARSPNVGLVTTMYDVIPLLRPDEYFPGRLNITMRARYEIHRSADAVVSISEATAAAAISVLGLDKRRVTVISAGLDKHFTPGTVRTEVLERVGIRPGYVLSVGNVDPRKNLAALITAFACLPAECRAGRQLVLTSSQADQRHRDDLMAVARHAGVADDVVVVGRVEDDDLVDMYRGAALVAFVPTAEGLGLPVLEALACGTAVVASDIDPLRDLIDPSERCDPSSSASISDTMAALLANHERRDEVATAGPGRVASARWDSSVHALEALYRRVATQ